MIERAPCSPLAAPAQKSQKSQKGVVWAAALWMAAWPVPSSATVNELVPPTSGIYTGVQFSQKIGDAFRSLASGNKGPTAPANVGGSTVDGLIWIDDSVSPWLVKKSVNGGWAVMGALDPADSSFAGVIGGGIATIASGATVDLGSVPQANVLISGAATISSFGATAPAGIEKTIRFDNVSVLTPSGSLLVPGGFALTTAAGDRAKVTHLGSGNWEITQYTRANGIPVDLAAVGRPFFSFAMALDSLHVAAVGQALLRTSYPAYLAKTTRSQNGTRFSGNATITGVTNTAGFGFGMPVESTGVNAGCFLIAAVVNTSITLNSPSCVTASGISSVTVFPNGYGAGGTSAHVGVPDCRNRVLAGLDRSDPGSFANLLTSASNGFGTNSSIMGVRGGAENVAMTSNNLIAHTHANTLSDPGHAHGIAGSSSSNVFVGASTAGVTGPGVTSPVGAQGLVISPNITGVTINNVAAGFGTPLPMRSVQPTLIANCVIRVIP
jgi:hypothetical protein